MSEIQVNMIVEYQPEFDDIKTIRQQMGDFNDQQLKYKSKPLAIFLKDNKNTLYGGILARLDAESVYVDVIWLDESIRLRRFGSQLLQAIEKEALKHGCKVCTLDTYEFQAEQFYLKNGYHRIGEIKKYIREYSRIFLRKNLV